jgi:hypothetical protein
LYALELHSSKMSGCGAGTTLQLFLMPFFFFRLFSSSSSFNHHNKPNRTQYYRQRATNVQSQQYRRRIHCQWLLLGSKRLGGPVMWAALLVFSPASYSFDFDDISSFEGSKAPELCTPALEIAPYYNCPGIRRSIATRVLQSSTRLTEHLSSTLNALSCHSLA